MVLANRPASGFGNEVHFRSCAETKTHNVKLLIDLFIG